MTIEIRGLTLGMVQTNSYIIADTESKQAILIDPVDEAEFIMENIEEMGCTLKLILATHGHFDHVLASKELKELSGAPFYINERDQAWLDNLPRIGVQYVGQPFPEAAKPDRYLTDAPETIEIGAIKLETLFTPGHCQGHICFYLREHKILFGGDCLFQGSIGRVDLPGGNYEELMQSIFNKIIPLGDDVQVLSGHGPETTIGHERQTNPFLLSYAQ